MAIIRPLSGATNWGRSGTHVTPKACVYKLAKMAGIGGDDNDLGSDGQDQRLRGKDDINVEVERRRSKAPLQAGFCPELGGEAQRLVGQGQISVRVNLHEGIQTSEPRSLTCAEQFAPQFVVNDGRHQDSVAARKAIDEPFIAATSGESLSCVTSPSGPESSRR